MPATAPVTPWVRDISSDVGGVKNTFSSWDACMAQDYCKWPAIIGIVIGSLIVLSILTCIVRCCCCGMECCCACCSCCNACCPGPRNKRSKYADQPGPPHGGGGGPGGYQGYQPNPPPFYGNQGGGAQFAQFDASRKIHADSLPAMPSWDNAPSKKILDENHQAHEEVEMDHMGPHHPVDEAAAPMLAHQAPTPSGGGGGPRHGDAFADGTAAPLPYQDRISHPGGYGQQPYGGGGEAQDYYGAGAAAAGPQGHSLSPPPQQSPYGGGQQQLLAGQHQAGYRGVSPTGGHTQGALSGGGGGAPLPTALQPAALASRQGGGGAGGAGGYQSYTPYGSSTQQQHSNPQTAYSAYAPASSTTATSSTMFEPSYPSSSVLPQQHQQQHQGGGQPWRDI